MSELVNNLDKGLILITSISAIFILFILIIILFVRLNSYIKKQNQLIKYMNNESIEDLLIKNINIGKTMFESNEDIKREIEFIKSKLSNAIQNEGYIKYSAMADVGGDISYSAALLDDYGTGFVITGLYYRDGMNTFVKEVVNGKSKSKLTPEEEKAIELAIENKKQKNVKII